MQKTKQYIVKKFISLDKVDWKNIPKANIDIFKWTNNYKPKSYGQMVFINDFGFVVNLTSQEANPIVLHTEDNSNVHKDSCLEFFVKFGKEGFLNFEANANAVKKIKFGPEKANREFVLNTHPNLFSIEQGQKSNKEWSLIEKLPIEDILQLYPSIKSNDFKSGFEFSGNFYHMGTDPNKRGFYYGMWNEVNSKTPDYYHPECFGKFIIE